MKSKRGAIELSMTTIIVVILGVVLLVLGLTFVKGIFDETGGLTDEAFSNAKKQLGNIGQETNQEFTVSPENMKLDQGDGKFGGAIVKNIHSDGPHTYKIKVKMAQKPGGSQGFINCYLKTTGGSEGEATLSTGDYWEFPITVEDTGDSPLGIYACGIEFYKDGVLSQNLAIGITVQ